MTTRPRQRTEPLSKVQEHVFVFAHFMTASLELQQAHHPAIPNGVEVNRAQSPKREITSHCQMSEILRLDVVFTRLVIVGLKKGECRPVLVDSVLV